MNEIIQPSKIVINRLANFTGGADFYAMEPSATNGHLGTIALLDFARANSSVSYLWNLPNDEKICCSIHMIQENDPDKPENFEERMKPVRVLVSKFAPNSAPLPYSPEDFARDIQDDLVAETVSISCTV